MKENFMGLQIKHTLRKNNPPAGNSIRWDPGNIFNGTPSLYHWIVGEGVPSALQFNVAGSCLGTVVSIGCSVMRGRFDPANEIKRNFNFYLYSSNTIHLSP